MQFKNKQTNTPRHNFNTVFVIKANLETLENQHLFVLTDCFVFLPPFRRGEGLNQLRSH